MLLWFEFQSWKIANPSRIRRKFVELEFHGTSITIFYKVETNKIKVSPKIGHYLV